MADDPEQQPDDDGFAALDAREALFTGALQRADRIANQARAMRLQVMLAGFDAMVLEEQAEGRTVELDGPCARAFLLHQSTVLRIPRQTVLRQLEAGWTLRERLPQTWAVLLEGGCATEAATVAADECEGLRGEALAEFDRVAAGLVAQHRPSVLVRRLGALRDRLDPTAVTGRHRRASAGRWVTARPEPDGQGVLTIRGTAVDVAASYDAIRTAAIAAHGREGECRTLGQLMADVAVDLILQNARRDAPDASDPAYPMERIGSLRVPHRKAVEPSVLVLIPASSATGADDQPAEVAGMGSIDAEVARRIVQHARSWSRVVVDPVDDAVLAIDAKERYIPSGLKRLIHARNPSCVGDDCGLPSHRIDLDHVVRVEHDGRTRHDKPATALPCSASHEARGLVGRPHDAGCGVDPAVEVGRDPGRSTGASRAHERHRLGSRRLPVLIGSCPPDQRLLPGRPVAGAAGQAAHLRAPSGLDDVQDAVEAGSASPARHDGGSARGALRDRHVRSVEPRSAVRPVHTGGRQLEGHPRTLRHGHSEDRKEPGTRGCSHDRVARPGESDRAVAVTGWARGRSPARGQPLREPGGGAPER
ncbi:hypothetical protein QDR37_00485 [Amnibacterium sp. CER49]|uniref:hypothetical protein n=1 Tax=Amnibacterium sp. CER49 TaxID=3039161 RepID=UPI002446E719|nr:hypothetical protein [Amnibacterium sp. CER49]MDH2442413.1 hypothetical protein [Amnibacterium sp. CER49]